MVQNSTVHSETVNSVSFVNIDQEVHLKLSPSSHNILIEWETEIERMLDDGGSLERMKDWGAKLAGATLRLAGVMHCVTDDISQAIGDETLSNAIRLARYLIPHAETVLGMMQASEDLTELDVRYVLQWILRQGEDHFTRRDVHRHGQNRFKTVEDVDPALVALTKRGYIRPKPCEVTGLVAPPLRSTRYAPIFLICREAVTKLTIFTQQYEPRICRCRKAVTELTIPVRSRTREITAAAKQ